MNSHISFPKEKKLFLLPGPAGQLEMMTTFPNESTRKAVGIVCHPHPLHEGTMHNKVVTTLARAFEMLDVPTVRFNFRGVGKSQGKFAETVGETEDLLAVVDWVQHTLSDYDIWLAGFSFGSYIAANAANQIDVKQLISIAPPVNHLDFTVFSKIHCPWLVIQGDQDEIVPLKAVEAWASDPPSPLTLEVIKEASHFFHGKLIELREIVLNHLKNNF